MTASIQPLIRRARTRCPGCTGTSTRSSRGSAERHSCREFDSSPIDIAEIGCDHRGRDPGALLLQSSELALHRGHGSRSQGACARHLRRQSSLRVLLRAHLSLLSEGVDARQVLHRAECRRGLLPHDAQCPFARLRHDLERRHWRPEGRGGHAGDSADCSRSRGALHRTAEADRTADEGAAPAAGRGLVDEQRSSVRRTRPIRPSPPPHIRSSRSAMRAIRSPSGAPQLWGWERISDFRGYAVWAKSPIAGVYRSRRQGDDDHRRAPHVAAGRRRLPCCRCHAVGWHAHDRTREGAASGCAAGHHRSGRWKPDLHRGAVAAGRREAIRRVCSDGWPETSRCPTTASTSSRCFRYWSIRPSRSGCSTRSRAFSSREEVP